MFRKLAAASVAVSLSLAATTRPAQAWELIEWNGATVWGAEWTDDTQLGWGLESVDAWYQVYFDGYASAYHNGQDPLPGLASTVLYKLTEISADKKSWTFDYIVQNASADPVTESQVNAIGFDVTRPNYAQRLKSVSLAAGGEYVTVGSGAFGPMNDSFDVCFTSKFTSGRRPSAISSQSGCSPGGDVGPELGESGDGTFTLKFNSARSTVAFTNPFVSYDNIEFTNPDLRTTMHGSYYSSSWGKDHKHSKGCGHKTDDSGYGTPVAWVPEPSTWALMIFGFGGAGVALRSRRRLHSA